MLTGSQDAPSVSVVVPSYQSSRYIRSALQALVTQQTAIPYEIIVVDSSTDGTERIVEKEFPQVRLLHFTERCQVGRARNLGVDAARGKVVLFTDADTVPCATWVDQMAGAIRDLGVDGVAGSMGNGTPWSVTGCAGYYLEFFRFVPYRGDAQPANYLVGGNSGFRREILCRSRYDDRHSAGEDMQFSARVAREGGKLVFLPRAWVLHQNRTGFRTLLKYQRYLGAGACFYRQTESPESLRPFQAVPPLIFLAPFGIMFWIASTLLSRGAIQDFLRFMMVLPVSFIGNMAWALGFYEALRQPAQVKR